MIGFLKGEICDISEDNLVIEVSGVGYNVGITAKTADLLPGIGEEIKVYTYMSVREDAVKLYGFLTHDDLDFFKMLITVNGIGPKGAQSILAVMNPDELRYAIIAGDAKTLSKCPGVGAKSAQRIILDLKDKVSIEDTFNSVSAQPEKVSGKLSDARKEAAEALTALGFSASDSLRAVRKVGDADDMSVEDIIKAALKFISA